MPAVHRRLDSGRYGRTVAPRLSRRTLLGLGLAPVALALADCSTTTTLPKSALPTALVYRGPASVEGCPEAMAAILRSGPAPFNVVYCGPDEAVPLSRDALDQAVLYGQPGGGDNLDAAWRSVRSFTPDLKAWVRAGGRYLGICMGGYLAGSGPGYDLFHGNSDEYITEPGATVHTTGDALVTVSWRDTPATIYFQDGPGFSLDPGADAQVLARYSNGSIAALVAQSGRGRVGVCGPHPEAERWWYTDAGLTPPDPLPLPLAHDLVATTISNKPLRT